MKPALIATGAAVGLGLWAWWNNAQANTGSGLDAITGASGGIGDAIDQTLWDTTGISMSTWQSDLQDPTRGGPYQSTIAAAESANGIPEFLLARLLWQESRFRPDIISCQTKSSVGAEGIAQFMPATAAGFKINPCDPVQAINAAGKYLAQLFGMFGSWTLALYAYNWGPGNVRKWVNGQVSAMPAETSNYAGQILADLSSAGYQYS